MHVSVAGKSRRSEHTLQFYYIALDLPFKTYLFSKSDIKHPPPKHMYFLDKYLNIYIYPSSAVYVLIMSRNSKITMQIFFFHFKVTFTAFLLLDLMYFNFYNQFRSSFL